MKNRRHAVWLAAVMVPAAPAAVLVSSPAAANPPGAQCDVVYFTVSMSNPLNSLFKTYDNCSLTQQFRGGSGLGSTSDTCQPNVGPLPNGDYSGIPDWHQDNRNGEAIDGRTWRLQDKACPNGLIRNELFVHSEETISQGQNCPTAGDDPHCWEGVGDYASNGCIKLAPPLPGTDGGLHLFNVWWHNKGGGTGTSYGYFLTVNQSK